MITWILIIYYAAGTDPNSTPTRYIAPFKNETECTQWVKHHTKEFPKGTTYECKPQEK